MLEGQNFMDAAMYCAVISEGQAEHCSVVFRTRKFKYLQMDFSPEITDDPKVLFIRCRLIAESKAVSDLITPSLKPKLQETGRTFVEYFDSHARIINEDPNLGPYRPFPKSSFWLDMKLDQAVVVPGYPNSDLIAPVWLYIKKVPPFFQMLISDCQTFATNILKQFARGGDKSLRRNENLIGRTCLKTFHPHEESQLHYPTETEEFAGKSEIKALKAFLDKKNPSLPSPRARRHSTSMGSSTDGLVRKFSTDSVGRTDTAVVAGNESDDSDRSPKGGRKLRRSKDRRRSIGSGNSNNGRPAT